MMTRENSQTADDLKFVRAWPLLILLFAFAVGAEAQHGETMTLDGRLASINSSDNGSDTSTARDELVAGRSVVRLGAVTQATVTWYPAADGAPAVLVLPGGGYRILATDLEGTEVAAWLNAHGIAALVLRYRVPTIAPHAEPLADAKAALALLQSHVAQWHIDPKHVGVIGFSAGAHLAGRLIAAIPASTLQAMLLIYPAYFGGNAPEVDPVSFKPGTPPTFLVQAQDDPIQVENATFVFAQLTKLKVPVELHVYAAGGHGYGLRPTASPVTHWPELAAGWLAGQGFSATARP